MCYDKTMNEDNQKIAKIKEWLGTGAINIFGLPMSGKDTQGIKLAEALKGKFLSSGIIIRAMEKQTRNSYSKTGNLIPTDVFLEWVLPYFDREDLSEYPLVLSSIGRWAGEEDQVMSAATESGHDIKAVVILNVSESDVEERFEKAKELGDRGDREDDKDEAVFRNRLEEFRKKTLPVLEHYRTLGLVVEINGDQRRDLVFSEMIEKLYQKALREL